MKKLLTLTFVMASLIFVVPTAQAKATSSVIEPTTIVQYRQERNRRYNNQYRRQNRRVYYTYHTRTVRRGFRLYRETYRITHYPNGRYTTQIIRRIRIR